MPVAKLERPEKDRVNVRRRQQRMAPPHAIARLQKVFENINLRRKGKTGSKKGHGVFGQAILDAVEVTRMQQNDELPRGATSEEYHKALLQKYLYPASMYKK